MRWRLRALLHGLRRGHAVTVFEAHDLTFPFVAELPSFPLVVPRRGVPAALHLVVRGWRCDCDGVLRVEEVL